MATPLKLVPKNDKEEVVTILREIVDKIERGEWLAETFVAVIQCSVPGAPDECVYKVPSNDSMDLKDCLWLLEMGRKYVTQ